MAEKQLNNPTGAFGYTGISNNLGPRTTHSFVAAGTITSGKLVVLGSAGTITQAATSSTALVCGVAIESGVSGDLVQVVTYGLVEVTKLSSETVASGDLLIPSTATAGNVVSAGTTVSNAVCGVAVTVTSTSVTMWFGLRG
jgi:predicted RecA/RadA family phage recombinase